MKNKKALKFWMSVFYTMLLAALIISVDLLIALAIGVVVCGCLYVVFEMIIAPLKPPEYGMNEFELKLYELERKKTSK